MMRLTPVRTAATLVAAAVLSLTPFLSAAPITGGNLVVIRVGDGATTASGTALPVTLDEYQVTYTAGIPTGASLVQSIPLPTGAAGTAPSSGQRYLGQGGTAGGEGGLTLSTNGLYMALAGYNSGLGDVTNPGAAGTEVRVVGRLELSTGTVDTSTTLALSGSSAIRNAFTSDGNDIWTATSAQGVRYTTFGNSAGAGTALTGTGNERRVMVVSGQLYTSRQSAPVDGVATVGSGAPTSGTQTVTLLPGMPIVNTNASTYDYFFADASTLYVSDDRNSGTGGLQKWTFDGSAWSMAYSLLVNPTGAANVGIKSLNGSVDPLGNVTLFGSTTGTQGNYLYGFSDTLANTNVANVSANPLVSAGTAYTGSLWSLRGVALAPAVPEPASLAAFAFTLLPLLRRRHPRQA